MKHPTPKTRELIDWVFENADEHTGCHAPYAMAASREAIALIREAVVTAIEGASMRVRLALESRLVSIDKASALLIELRREAYYAQMNLKEAE